MKRIKNILLALLSLTFIAGCYSDDADNPIFRSDEMARIYNVWSSSLSYEIGDTVELEMDVSPIEGTTFAWTLNGELISEEKDLLYVAEESGAFELKYMVTRDTTKNSRTATLNIIRPYVPPTYNKIALGFLTPNGTISNIQWGNITHLVLSSIVVAEDGTFATTPDNMGANLTDIVDVAHSNNVMVIAEFSGIINNYNNAEPAYGGINFINATQDATTRAALVSNIVQYAVDNDLDGVNIYMDAPTGAEFGDKEAGLKSFYDELAAAVPAETERGAFLLTMTLYTSWIQGAFTNLVNNPRYNWYNLKVVGDADLTPSHHGSISRMEAAVTHWGAIIDKSKLMPVAGAFGIHFKPVVDPDTEYTWGNIWKYTTYPSYKWICDNYADAESMDKIEVDNGIFYENLTMIEQRAQYVIDQDLAGLGLWGIEGDATEAEKSLGVKIKETLGN